METHLVLIILQVNKALQRGKKNKTWWLSVFKCHRVVKRQFIVSSHLLQSTCFVTRPACDSTALFRTTSNSVIERQLGRELPFVEWLLWLNSVKCSVVSSVVATMPCFFIWVEVWLRLAPCSLPWWGGGLAVRVLPLWAQEHSRHTNKAIAVLLLQCWVDKSFSAGLLPLKRRSCASPLVNDLTHFFPPLQSFHKSLLSGYRCYSPSPFPPSCFLNHPPTPTPPQPFIIHPYCKQMEEKVSISNMFFPPSEAPFHPAEPAWD